MPSRHRWWSAGSPHSEYCRVGTPSRIRSTCAPGDHRGSGLSAICRRVRATTPSATSSLPSTRTSASNSRVSTVMLVVSRCTVSTCSALRGPGRDRERQVQVVPDVHVRRGPVAHRRRRDRVVARCAGSPSSRATFASSRASGAPRQPCMPSPNPRWRNRPRLTSKRSGSREPPLVAVRRAVDQHHPAAGRDRHAVQGDLARRAFGRPAAAGSRAGSPPPRRPG